jgi:asparagine synthase (glutamine-hydrolysing)
MYRSLVSAWQTPPVPPHDGDDGRAAIALRDTSFSLLERMMLADQHSYLPDDLLAKVDRASMAVSLEVRVPILDHRVCEFSWRLPDSLKLRDGIPKWILRQVLERRVPPELFERPKVGFSVPLAAWLRGPLVEWAEDLLAPASLAQDDLLDVGYIRDTWSDFKKGRNNAHLAIWAVLMFQAWRQRWSLPSGRLAMEMAD